MITRIDTKMIDQRVIRLQNQVVGLKFERKEGQ